MCGRYLRQLIAVLTVVIPGQALAAAEDGSPGDLINPDRPGIADGSNVVTRGRWQIETGVQVEFRRDGATREQRLFIPTLIRFGLIENLELRLESNSWTAIRTVDRIGVENSAGFSPSSVGLKYHFLDAEGARRPSMAAILRVFPASGTRRLQTRRATGDFRIAADWDFAENWSLNPNIGIGTYDDDLGRPYSAGLLATTLTFSPTKAFSVFVDAGVQSPEAKFGKTSILLDVGATYLIGRDWQVDVSVGYGAAGKTPPRPFVSAGVSARF